MLLQLLREYSQRLDLPPTLYSERAVRYWIDLDGQGNLLGAGPVDTADPDSRAQRRGRMWRVPYVQRTSTTRPLLFADTAEYTFGLPIEPDKPRSAKRALRRHTAYLDLLADCHRRTENPFVGAVRRFLESSPLDRIEWPEEFDSSATITFTVEGCTAPGRAVAGLESVQAFWATHNRPSDEDADLFECLVCAEVRPAERRLKEKVKGIPGGQTAGTSLISANEEAFRSYGLEESLIAPVCGECSESFTKGLNGLLASSDAIRLGGMKFAAWTREARKDDVNVLGVAVRPQDFEDELDIWDSAPPAATPRDVRSQLDAGYREPKPRERHGQAGRAYPESADRFRPSPAPLDAEQQDQLYALGVSAAGGRAAVRSLHSTTVGEAVERARLWFERQRIVGAYGERPWSNEAPRVGLLQLAGATVRELRDLPAPVPRALLHGFLTGEPLSADLLIRAVRRVQADRDVRRNQAALIKLVLRSNPDAGEEDDMVSLNQEGSEAYQCGRLFAELENAQRAALGDVKASIVNRYFRRASTAPQVVFGPLVQLSQAHLDALERDPRRRGAYRAIQQRLEEIMQCIGPQFPDVLAPREQGEFVLGYYHQRAEHRREAREAIAARQAGSRDDA